MMSPANARFPKFVLDRSTHLHELRKAMGTSKLIDSSTAYRSEVPGKTSPPGVQRLQIDGTGSVQWSTWFPLTRAVAKLSEENSNGYQ